MGYAEDAIAELHGMSVNGPYPDERADATWKVLMEVDSERDRQNAKWGEQNHGPAMYFAILAEEVGEVAKEVVEFEALVSEDVGDVVEMSQRIQNARTELIQTAAVAVAMVECLDRNFPEVH